MEENENNNVVEAGEASNEKSSGNGNKILDVIKTKKNLIVTLVVVLIAVLVIIDILVRSPKETVKKYFSAVNACNSKKAEKYEDDAGFDVFYKLSDDDYEEFWEEYNEYINSEEWAEREETIKETRDKDYYKEQDEDAKETKKENKSSVKVKKVTDVKKVGKHLYEVKAKLQTKSDGDKNENTVKIYVMKKGLKSYIVGFDY